MKISIKIPVIFSLDLLKILHASFSSFAPFLGHLTFVLSSLELVVSNRQSKLAFQHTLVASS